MATPQPDATQEWRLPEGAKPPLVSELVERIDEAVAIARSSEAAIMTVGAAALDAAEQARRAAELAERASASMSSGGGGNGGRPIRLVTDGDEQLRDFAARADRVAERLRVLAG
ncbi:MAG TPA: hypothetical protein VFU04_06390 [Solirubrobacterales bacterium]|nr:hypothetical protein [Solirubrobacterales bacterium]